MTIRRLIDIDGVHVENETAARAALAAVKAGSAAVPTVLIREDADRAG